MRGWVGSTGSDLRAAQARATEAFDAAMAAALAASGREPVNREAQLDARRRLDALKQQQAALLAHAEKRKADSAAALARLSQPRVVIAHRNDWVVRTTCDALRAAQVQVVATVDDGAHAVGIVVAEQPDLVLVEDLLPSTSGLDVLEAARRWAPRTCLAAQLNDASKAAAFLDAGASAVFARRVPPSTLAQGLVELLADPAREPLVSL